MKSLYVIITLTLYGLSTQAQCGSNPIPVADFSLTSGCGFQTIYFNNLSTISSGSIVSWEWDFGDGSPINTSINPSYQYNGGGSFSVKLIVTSNFGCKDSITKTSNVFPEPNAFCTVDATFGCGQLCVSFMDASSISSGTIVQWEWDFGDGSPVNTSQNPNYCYTNTGTYNGALTVTSDNGCASSPASTPFIITVYPGVGYTTSYDSLQNEFTIMVDTTTTNYAVSYNWDFGDGTSSSLDTPSHIYAVDSIYNVCMKTYLYSGDSCIYCDSIGKGSLGNIIRNGGFKLNILNANSVSGIPQNFSTEPDFVIFPNPSTGIFRLENINPKVQSIRVYNLWGEKVFQSSNTIQSVSTEIDLTAFPKGVYFVNVLSGSKVYNKKIIIQ